VSEPEKRFPIHSWSIRNFPRCPKSVPWGLVQPHEKQAFKNHDQSLACLASRGGLCASEFWAVLNGTRWRHELISEDAAVDWLIKVIEVYEAEKGGDS
jgi:hypothetical protein